MTKRIAKFNSNNIRANFNASPEIGYWAKKYNTSLEEIQEIFKDAGYSISKTIIRLQEKVRAA